jgi:hypothetical protein
VRFVRGGSVLAATGTFRGAIQLGETPVAASSARESFVSSHDDDGVLRWAMPLHGTGDVIVGDVGVTSDGAIALVGSFGVDVSVGEVGVCDTSRSGDAFVVGLDPMGHPQWTRCLGSSAADDGTALVTAAEGDVIVAGTHGAPIDLGGGELPVTTDGGAFLARLAAADGAHVWSTELRTELGERPIALAIDAAGDVIVAGHDANGNLFATKRSGSDGGVVWTREVVTDPTEFLLDAAVGPDGDVVLLGWSGTRVSSSGAFRREAALRLGLAGDDGHVRWTVSDPRLDVAAGVVSAEGDLLVTGTFVGTFGCGDGTASTAVRSDGDVFLARFSAEAGALVSFRRWGGAYSDAGLGVVAQGDRVILAGYLDATDGVDAFGDARGAGISLFEVH